MALPIALGLVNLVQGKDYRADAEIAYAIWTPGYKEITFILTILNISWRRSGQIRKHFFLSATDEILKKFLIAPSAII